MDGTKHTMGRFWVLVGHVGLELLGSGQELVPQPPEQLGSHVPPGLNLFFVTV